MKFKKDHEPRLNDMDDYHRPMPRKKLRTILLAFLLVGAVWALYKGIEVMILQP